MQRIYFSLCAALLVNSAFADESTVPLKAAVRNLPKQISGFQKKVQIPVAVPINIPADSGVNNLGFHTDDEGQYQLYLSNKRGCEGEKSCMVGMISAERGGNPSIIYNMENKEITEKLNLSAEISGYFTPSYALASTAPAEMAFRCKNVLFRVSWSTATDEAMEKSIVLNMAKEIIQTQDICMQ